VNGSAGANGEDNAYGGKNQAGYLTNVYGYGGGPYDGSGGNSGGYSVTYLTGLTPGNTLTVVVGAAGTGGNAGGGQGFVLIEY
jgi:hypothetical protein